MKAFIFNSGVGSRLGELTSNSPKALVKLKSGETLLGRQLRLLKRINVKDVVISTGYKEEIIRDFCLKEFPELNFSFVFNPLYDRTNSIYSMWLAAKYLRDSDFIIMHGDLVFDEGILGRLVKDNHKNLACINKYIHKPEKDFKGRIDKYGYLREISVHIFEKNDFALQPLYKLNSETINQWLNIIETFIKQDNINVYAEVALNKYLADGSVKVIDYSKNLLEEIDNLDDYARVSEQIRNYDFNCQPTYEGDYLKLIRKILKDNKFNKPFIVYSRAAFKNPKFSNFLQQFNAVAFNGYSPNPKYEEVVAGLNTFKENDCDVIIAIGGGSCMDVAKAIKLFSVLDPSIHYLKQKPKYAKVPLIAVPTTAGTGSEATRYAVIYDKGVKQSLVHDSIFPTVAIIDPSFLEKLPDYHRKSSFLDAFCQAIEGYWAASSNQMSRKYSEVALVLFLESYEAYLRKDSFVNDKVMECAYFAGQAINITTTTAPHAMSYKLTTLTGIAHGHAVSVTLPYVLEYMVENINTKDLQLKLEKLSIIFGVQLKDLSTKIKDIISTFALPNPSVTEQDLDQLVASVNIERLSNNPLQLDPEVIRMIYRKSLNIK